MRLFASLLLLSAASLAYELALMRAFSLTLWHHFAYMVISIALLGFGASGTFLSLWWRRGRNAERSFGLFAFLFALSIPVCFAAAQRIPFDPTLLLWDRRQLLVLGGFYLVFFLPFFLAATAVGLLLIERARQAPRVYFYNLLGSGLGSLLLVIFLYLVPPERAVLAIYAVALTAVVLLLPAFSHRTQALTLLLLVGFFYFLHFVDAMHIRISPYKSLSLNLELPEAEILEQRFSPLGRVDVLRSPAFRYAPGLSLADRATPPPQLALFIDAESAGALTAYDGRRQPLEFLDWTTAAAPYHLLARPGDARVLILGAGGGTDLLLARYHDVGHIDAVEINPQIVSLVRKDFADFTGGLYRLPGVDVHVQEARAFLEGLPRDQAPDRQLDVIQVSLLDSLAASTAGVHALNESYLYTVEALARATDHLSPDGSLAITRWLTMPPRDAPKLFATAVVALEDRGLDPTPRLALIRSWATYTLLVKRVPFTPEEIAALQAFCQERLFDLAYYPGITAEEANRFTHLAQPYYFDAAREILAGGSRRAAFLRDYPFNLAPATDDRPDFSHFFRWRALPILLRTYGRQWLPFLEWGYLILVATLAQAALLSVVLILLPLLLRRRTRGAPPPGSISRLPVLAYFLAIGLGYLFIEIVLIQKFTLFLANPIYAVAVVLTAVLVFSGLGSYSLRSPKSVGSPLLACALVAALSVVAAILLPLAVPPLLGLGLSTPVRVVVSLALMAPLAFLMGMPFPLAWQRLEQARADVLPWAWGVNGCASVLAAVLATLLAMSFGFRFVLVAAAALYLLAALSARAFAPRKA
jgi:hypothetical protein